jgi:O-antigen/teichoic acid export membrane protein
VAEVLKNKAYLASIWVIGGLGTSQALRLASNLILTRLLVPEFFGIMAIAQVFMMGLGLFF